ncbi:MAG TPA: helix-turn-helix domain-containing GNAT family N-acetyltransferase [Rudaea sp.]
MHDLATDVATIRDFNRFYTQKIGVLREGLLDSEFSLAEVRVLYELAHRDGAAASALAAQLDLDPGYLSRILQRFEKRRYIVRRVAQDDARRRDVTLTAAGRRAFGVLDARAQQEMTQAIAPLGEAARRKLLGALASVRSMLDPQAPTAPIVLRGHRPGDMGWVVQRHGEIYAAEYGWNEEFEALVAQITADFVRTFDGARERCWIAERDGRRIGSIFLVAKSRTIAKLRLLLVEPDARGSGLGKRLVDECVAFARTAGYRKVVLWTQSNLLAARKIYAAVGFQRVDAQKNHSFGHDLVSETWELKLQRLMPDPPPSRLNATSS